MAVVLIVDDEYIERWGLATLFSQYFPPAGDMPCHIFEAKNGREGLAVARREKPDILITDIKMPVMDGISLIRQAAAEMPSLATIIITAYGEFEYAQAAIECRVSHYILKPISPVEFERVIKTTLAEIRAMPKQPCSTQVQHPMDYDAPEAQAPELVTSERVIRDVIAILYEEYMLPDISLESIAARVYLSPSYLSHIFRKSTGQTLFKYITNLRLNRARALLSNTNMKITDVSTAVGYRNVSYFCTVFKAAFEVTPAQFKEMSIRDDSIWVI